MKKPAIELADTTFRAYRKRNGAIALHLRSYLLVHTNPDFRAEWERARTKWRAIIGGHPMPAGLSLFLDVTDGCSIRLPGKQEVACEVSYSTWPVPRSAKKPGLLFEDVADDESMLFDFWVKTVVSKENVEDCIGEMKLRFRLSFPGRIRPEEVLIQRRVPVVTRFSTKQGLSVVRGNS